MRVGFVQNQPTFGEVETNLSSVEARVRKADASLLVLPELFTTGYQFKNREEALSLAESAYDGPTTKRLLSLLKAKGDMYLVYGICEKYGGKIFNSAILAGPDGIIGLYRKSHLFGREKSIFTPGDTGFQVFMVGNVAIGILICFDWRFPECARLLALKGADIICHPSNLVLPHAPDGMITRSLENGFFSITANRVGSEHRIAEEKLEFIGKSQVVDPEGNVLIRASDTEDEMCFCTIDPARAKEKRINAHNDLLEDRRQDLYILKSKTSD